MAGDRPEAPIRTTVKTPIKPVVTPPSRHDTTARTLRSPAPQQIRPLTSPEVNRFVKSCFPKDEPIRFQVPGESREFELRFLAVNDYVTSLDRVLATTTIWFTEPDGVMTHKADVFVADLHARPVLSKLTLRYQHVERDFLPSGRNSFRATGQAIRIPPTRTPVHALGNSILPSGLESYVSVIASLVSADGSMDDAEVQTVHELLQSLRIDPDASGEILSALTRVPDDIDDSLVRLSYKPVNYSLLTDLWSFALLDGHLTSMEARRVRSYACLLRVPGKDIEALLKFADSLRHSPWTHPADEVESWRPIQSALIPRQHLQLSTFVFREALQADPWLRTRPAPRRQPLPQAPPPPDSRTLPPPPLLELSQDPAPRRTRRLRSTHTWTHPLR